MTDKKDDPIFKKEGDRTGSHNAEGGSATINDRTGLYIAILAMTLAALSLGGQLFNKSDQVIDAKIKAALAPVEEKTRTAATDSRLALDRADKLGAQLEAKRLIKLDNH